MRHFTILSFTFILFSCQFHSVEKSNLPLNLNEITQKNVGPIYKGMTIKELYETLPEHHIKKFTSYDKKTGETSEYYYIYDDSTHLRFIVIPKYPHNVHSQISQLIIKDKTLQTSLGIHLHSTVEELKKAYPKHYILHENEQLILSVPEIDAHFKINPQHLPPQAWDDSIPQMILNKLPPSTPLNGITIVWDYGSNNFLEKGFWKELLQQVLHWCLTRVPAIIFWSLVFVGALRLLRILNTRLKKIAKERIQHHPHIDPKEAYKRIETLFSIFFGIGHVLLWCIFILILLSKFNLNVLPLLASAGIIGLTLGLGAQELIRDYISGLFILLENQIRTGDIAIINGTVGTVEKIAIRTTTLRDNSGVVHIFQNGKINSLSNMTKGWSAIIIDIRVSYNEDIDQINRILRQVGDELMKEKEWKSILLDVELLGIDNFLENAMILKVKLTTQSGEQWLVSREYRMRIKKAFDARNIEKTIT